MEAVAEFAADHFLSPLFRNAMMAFRSVQASRFLEGSRSKYAGWNVTISGKPLNSKQRPRSEPIDSRVPSRVSAAVAPRAQTARGWIAFNWRSTNPRHAATSSRSGLRLFGGRHLTMLQM